jgi:DNA polymerase-3 subunit delta
MFSFLTEKELIHYVARKLSKANMKISSRDGKFFIDTVGYELRVISKEVSKLIDYIGDHEIATKADIEAICTKHIEAKIFELVDAVGTKNRERALLLYQDMISLKEPITRILFMIVRQISLIYKVKLMKEKRMNNNDIAKTTIVPEFVVRNLVAQGEKFSHEEIKNIIKQLVELEYESKSGRINLVTGIELMILKLSR